MVVDLLRAGVLVVLATAVVTGRVSILVVLITMFVLGVAEVFADTTSGTLLPMVVAKDDLGIGNARLMAGFLTTNQLDRTADRRGALRRRRRVAVHRRRPCCVALGAVLISRMTLPRVVAARQSAPASGPTCSTASGGPGATVRSEP